MRAPEFKRVKNDKGFVPASVGPEDELYPNGIFEFNITKMLAFLKANADTFQVESVAVEELGSSFGSLDESTIEIADLTAPIVLAEISPGRFSVIDGNHRAEKARRLGVKNIPAYRVRSDVHFRFLTSDRAYRTYVSYWNSKVSDRKRKQSRVPV